MYQTEAMERQNEALPAYKNALAAQGLAAKVVPGQDHRSRHRVAYAPDYINYSAEGFIRGQLCNWKSSCARTLASITDFTVWQQGLLRSVATLLQSMRKVQLGLGLHLCTTTEACRQQWCVDRRLNSKRIIPVPAAASK
jgi:hypothetical protein